MKRYKDYGAVVEILQSYKAMFDACRKNRIALHAFRQIEPFEYNGVVVSVRNSAQLGFAEITCGNDVKMVHFTATYHGTNAYGEPIIHDFVDRCMELLEPESADY